MRQSFGKWNLLQPFSQVRQSDQEGPLDEKNNTQAEFEAAVDLLYDAFPSPKNGGYNNDDWTVLEMYLPVVTSVAKRYTDSQSTSKALRQN
jgi:hypothetical protein